MEEGNLEKIVEISPIAKICDKSNDQERQQPKQQVHLLTNKMHLYTEEELERTISSRMMTLKQYGEPLVDKSVNKQHHHHQRRTIHKRPKKRMMSFVQSNRTIEYLKENDIVLIRVPEEMQIMGVVDPILCDKRARVCSFGSEEVQVQMLDSHGEIVTVPHFCICMQEMVWKLRVPRT
jgi:hypothetical protein